MSKPTKREMRLKLDDATLARHKEYFTDGDYARISEMASTPKKKVPRKLIMDAFGTGIAPQSIAVAISKYYANKAIAQQELAGHGEAVSA